MAPQRFDGFVQTLGATASRRRTLATLLAGLVGLVALPSEAKKKHKPKKKKCKKPKVKCKKKCCPAGQVCSSGKCTAPPPPPAEECQFTKTATLWTLQGNCTITKTIEIPDGVTLDGNGKTITMSGIVSGYFKEVPDDWAVAAGVLANGGSANVHDLTIRGGNLTGSCSDGLVPEGLSFINTAGEIRNVTVEEIALPSGPCGFGITATGTGGQAVSVEDVTVSGCPSTGVLALTRPNTVGITVSLDGATVTMDEAPPLTAVSAGIAYLGGRIAGTIANVSVSAQGSMGIFILGQGEMTGQVVEIADVAITDTEVTGIFTGILLGDDPNSGFFTVNVSRADITLTDDPLAPSGGGIYFGLGFGADISGTVDDSIIRGGFVGILQEGADHVTIQNTTVEDSVYGVLNWGGDLIAHDNILSGVVNGVGLAKFAPVPFDATITNNTIEGNLATTESAFGILVSDGATGTVTGNTISNFFDTDVTKPSCGIAVFENAGEVTIGENDFPDPPGNEEDICLDVPIPMALRQAKKSGNLRDIEALRHMRNRADRFKASDHAGRDRRRSKQKNKGGRAHQKRGAKH